MKLLLGIIFSLLGLFARCQNASNNSTNSKYLGKYSVEGMVVQVAKNNGSLILIVPGAPFQELILVEKNKFKTSTFGDEIFTFFEKNGKVEQLISQRSGQSLKLKKISNIPDDFNNGDTQLNLRKKTDHFYFFYSDIDSLSISNISDSLEASYKKILSDFNLENIPVTIVRIYPNLISLHKGINFPNAPDNVLATAFGKNDLRMVSPNNAGPDSSMLDKGVIHEFTHCVHLNIDYSPNNPRWLWEGVAMYESNWFLDPKQVEAIREKKFPHLKSLNNGAEYELGFVIIEAIKEIWGFDTVISLIKKHGDTLAVLKINDKEFEDRIFNHIYKKYITK